MRVDGIGLTFDSIFSSLYSGKQNTGTGALNGNRRPFSDLDGVASIAAADLANKAMSAKLGDLTDLSTEELAEYKKQANTLKEALVSTIKFAGEEFGDKVATVVAAMLFKNVSNGVTEENFGEGLLDATRFIDKKLGVESGDKFLSNLNTVLNPELNKFFDNGSDEVFIAVNTGDQSYTVPGLSDKTQGSVDDTLAQQVQQVQQQGSESAQNAFQTILDSIQITMKSVRENNLNQDTSPFIRSYDRNGQPLLPLPKAGFLMSEAV